MSTITEIATQIASILGTVPGIEATELDGYLPSTRTAAVALVIPPLNLSGTVAIQSGPRAQRVHRITCALWVKVNNKELAPAMNRGRDICLDCVDALCVDLTLGGTVMCLGDANGDVRNAFEWRVDEPIYKVGDEEFIKATLLVIATDWVVLPCH